MLNSMVSQGGWSTSWRRLAPGAGLLVALENLFPPLPSEVILPLAGFTASQGNFSLAGAIFWTTLGSVIGAIALYWIGVALGRRRLRVIVDKMPLVDLDDLDRTEDWFNRHGKATVFFGRMIPIFRSLISIPAGIERMSFLLFVALTAAGSLIWNSVLWWPVISWARIGISRSNTPECSPELWSSPFWCS